MTSVWDDVHYDAAASGELSRQLGAMATALGEASAAMAGEEAHVIDGWHGAYRGTFDGESADVTVVLAALVETALAAIAAVESALAAAQAEQAVRASARLRLLDAGVPEPRPEPIRTISGGPR